MKRTHACTCVCDVQKHLCTNQNANLVILNICLGLKFVLIICKRMSDVCLGNSDASEG
jgi:hypothetical protein